MRSQPRRCLAGLGLALVTFLMAALTAAVPSQAATAPQPASTQSMPDPGAELNGSQFLAFSTGSGLRESTASIAGGPWSAATDKLQALPPWTADSSIWAPDITHVTDGWVVYFSAVLKQTAGSPQYASGARCIGAATSSSPTGPFTAAAAPIVCLPGYGAADDMSADPANRVSNQGAIDASPSFVTIDGQRRLYLVYKTQGLPATIRMVRLSVDDGQTVVGDSHQLVYSVKGNGSGYTNGDTVEGPSLVQHGDWFVLFVAKGNYGLCSYSTAWYKSQHIWSWTNNSETPLITSSGSGICGPGGADVTGSEVSGQDRIFLHGWVCGSGTTPCVGQPGQPDPGVNSNARRVMYAAVLIWSSDGFTPLVGGYLSPS
jgi:arabinan endo-1,5-alpha-L-arabinosidase